MHHYNLPFPKRFLEFLEQYTCKHNSKLHVLNNFPEDLEDDEIDPKKVGIKFDNPDNLKGRDADYNANKIIDVFSGVKNEFAEAICLNAAAALIVCNKFIRFEDAYEFSKKHLQTDKVLTHLKKIQTFQYGKCIKKNC